MRPRRPNALLRRMTLGSMLAGCLVCTACSSHPALTSGSSSAAAGASQASAAAPVRSGTRTGRVHLTAYTTDDGPSATVIVTGAVGGAGKADFVNPDGSADLSHRHQLALTLADGSFRLDVGELDQEFTATVSRMTVNTATCSANAEAAQSVPVVRGSGTGAYRGIAGGFALTITLDEVYEPSQCNESGAYSAQVIVIAGFGTVTLG